MKLPYQLKILSDSCKILRREKSSENTPFHAQIELPLFTRGVLPPVQMRVLGVSLLQPLILPVFIQLIKKTKHLRGNTE